MDPTTVTSREAILTTKNAQFLVRTWFTACQSLNTTLITTLLFSANHTPLHSLRTPSLTLLDLLSLTREISLQPMLTARPEAQRLFGEINWEMNGLGVVVMMGALLDKMIIREREPWLGRIGERRSEVRSWEKKAAVEAIVSVTPSDLLNFPFHSAASMLSTTPMNPLIPPSSPPQTPPSSAKANSATTVLHLAAFFGDTHVTSLLLSRGADPTLMTETGHSVLECALSSGSTTCVGLIRKAVEEFVHQPLPQSPTKRGLEIYPEMDKQDGLETDQQHDEGDEEGPTKSIRLSNTPELSGRDREGDIEMSNGVTATVLVSNAFSPTSYSVTSTTSNSPTNSASSDSDPQPTPTSSTSLSASFPYKNVKKRKSVGDHHQALAPRDREIIGSPMSVEEEDPRFDGFSNLAQLSIESEGSIIGGEELGGNLNGVGVV